MSCGFNDTERVDEMINKCMSRVCDLISFIVKHERAISNTGDLEANDRSQVRGRNMHDVHPRSPSSDDGRNPHRHEHSPTHPRSRSRITFQEGPSAASVSSFIQRSAIEPEKYDGKTSLKSYLKKFERIAQWNQWTSSDKAFQLMINLTGSAALCMKTLRDEQFDDYGAIISQLKVSFGCPEIDWLELFVNCTRHKSESLIDFANQLQYLGFEALTTGIPDTLMVKKFIQGCDDSKLAEFLFMENPCNLDAVRKFVLKYQEFQKTGMCELDYCPEDSLVDVIRPISMGQADYGVCNIYSLENVSHPNGMSKGVESDSDKENVNPLFVRKGRKKRRGKKKRKSSGEDTDANEHQM